jgi:predicted nucleic acid-binding protein
LDPRGVSPPAYYQAKASFDKAGVAGLVRQKRGPRGPDKLQGEGLAFVERQLVAGQPIPTNDLWIAALAREHGPPVVTRDIHFHAVCGLRVLSW